MARAPRVAVTGLGQVSSLGVGVAAFRDRLLAGRPGIVDLPFHDVPGLDRPIGAAVPDFERVWPEGRQPQGLALVSRYAEVAAAEALAAAGLEPAERLRGAVVLGTGFGGMALIEEAYRQCFTRPGARPRPTVIPQGMANAAAGHLATRFRLKGPNLTLAVACSSSTHAIGQALRWLRAGDADLVLAGGAEAPLTPLIVAAWNVLRVLAPAGDDPARACRPFRRDRQGIVLGEGAGFLVLERLDDAVHRGAPVLCELAGYGANADAGHITHPDLTGVRACMELALADAGIEPGEVGHVNAHGTGTVVNDEVETRALAALFGGHAAGLLVTSTKATHGHAMGASGALEAIATVLALTAGLVPPTANLDQPDPGLPALDFVRGTARKADLVAAMSCSFAFGGSNAALVFRRI